MRVLFPSEGSVRDGSFNVYRNKGDLIVHGGWNRDRDKAATARKAARYFNMLKPLYAINVRMKKAAR